MANWQDILEAADKGEPLVVEPGAAKRIRILAGFSTTAVAAAVGVSSKSIERWENGIKRPQNLVLKQRYGRVLAWMARS